MTTAAAKTRAIGDFGRCLIGPLIWAADLLVLYGLHAVVCAHVPTASTLVRPAAWAITALALAGLIAFWVAQWRKLPPRDGVGRFQAVLTLWLAGLSGLGITWMLLIVIAVPACR